MTYSVLLSVVVTTIMLNGVNIQRVPTANNDLYTLKGVIERHNGTNPVNISEVLTEFKKATGLRVSNSDLVTYFSNLGVKFYTETV